MKKMICFFFISCFISIVSFSQSFMHGAGVGIYVVKSSLSDAEASFTLSYSPRYNFIEGESMSVSVGVPVNVGISGSYNAGYDSYYGSYEDNSLKAMINAPVLLNLNIGCGSTKENESRFGFFIGAGYGLHFGDLGKWTTDGYGYSYYESAYGTSFGPAGNAGIRIAVGSHQKNIEIRFSYMKGVYDYKLKVYGVNTYFNF